MKKQYVQPKAVVFELETDGLVMDNSIPGGGEIDMGGRGSFDAPSYRTKLWDEYEK